MKKEFQDNLIDTIQIIAGEKLKNISFTKSFSGVVKEINGKLCTIEAYEQLYECIIPESIINHVTIGEVAIVQDIFNNNSKRIIQGVITGKTIDGIEFHVYDPVENKIVSSVLQLYDESLGNDISGIIFDIE